CFLSCNTTPYQQLFKQLSKARRRRMELRENSVIGQLTSRAWTRLCRFLGLSEKPAKRIAGIKAAHLEPNQVLLDELRRLSNERLGFFPATARRAIEYPWFADRLLDCAGKRILDVGAGVNVLPLWLADRGATVVTVDPHPQVRDPSDKSHWNEWGYLDS